MACSKGRTRRSGNILVLAIFLMVSMMGMLAFAVDIGYLCSVRTDLQRTADAAAIAGAWELVADAAFGGTSDPVLIDANIRGATDKYAALNLVGGQAPALTTADVQIGYLEYPSDPAEVMTFIDFSDFNAVRVRVRRTSTQNGNVPFFFARVLGYTGRDTEAEATAALLKNIGGFMPPADGSNLGILPFAMDEGSWDAMLAGGGTDSWSYDSGTGVTAGADGIREVNLYPEGTGSPGNRGTVDFGNANNSTADIARQILDGLTPSDLAYHGGSLEFDASGELNVNGDTGISAGVKDELATLVGQTRVVPLFRSVVNPGNNAVYTLVRYVGVRILEVDLTGADKRVILQPAPVMIRGGIPASGSGAPGSNFVYSPAWLVR